MRGMPTPRSLVTDPFTTNLVRLKAAKLCRRADFSASDQEDVEQSILAYLKEKEDRVDLTRGSVEAFATHLVKTWIRMELRFRGRQRRLGNLMTISLERTFVEVDGDEEPLCKVIDPRDQQRRTNESRPCPLERIDVVDAVRHAFHRLSPQEQELLVYVSEHGVAAAAREWSRRGKRKVSRRTIDERIGRMRSRFEDAGLGGG